MSLPWQVVGAPAPVVRRVLARMEGQGLDHVLIADHVSFHTGWGVDGLIEATAMAMLNDGLGVSIGVYLLPLRHPVLVARQVATLAERAPGRLTFAVGVGGEDRHEVEVCGVDPATRGRRCDEYLAVLRRLLAGEPVDADGEFVRLDGALIRPTPDPAVPILVGGRAPAVLARAGRLGDGWLGIWSTSEAYAQRVATVEAHAGTAGRADACRSHGLQLWCGIGDDAARARAPLAHAMGSMYRMPFERFERWSPYGTPADVAAAFAPYVGAGCTTFNVAAQAATWEEAVDGLGEVKRLLAATTA